jgi:hypothetical protein
MRKLMPLSEYFPLLLHWLWFGRWYVAIILLPFLSLFWITLVPAMPWLGNCKERDARWIGWLLQAVGFIIVAWGYNSDAKQNERLSLRRWLSQFPRPFFGRILESRAVAFGESNTFGRGMIVKSISSSLTLEERIAALETNMKTYFDEVTSQVADVRMQHSNLSNRFNEYSTSTTANIDGLKESIAESVSGRVQLNLFAVALFLIGITIATLSPEVAAFSGNEVSCSAPLF